jgi:hypothetical protein
VIRDAAECWAVPAKVSDHSVSGGRPLWMNVTFLPRRANRASKRRTASRATTAPMAGYTYGGSVELEMGVTLTVAVAVAVTGEDALSVTATQYVVPAVNAGLV